MNRKYAVHPGAYELGENEKFYSDMEAKGWRLKKRGAYLSRFERTVPSSARYRVDVFQPDAWAAKDLPEEQKAVFEDCGWEYVCPSLPLHIFRAPAGSGAPEFYDDPAQQAETLKKMKRDAVWGWVPTLAVWAVWLFIYLTLNGAGKFAAEFQLRLVELPSLFLLAGTLLLQEFYSRVRKAWIITRTYRRMKKGIPLDHSPGKRRWVHKAVNGTLWALVLLSGLLLAAQLIFTRSADLPEETADPYLLLSSLELAGEQTSFMGQDSCVTYSPGLLADYWDTREYLRNPGHPEYALYQDVYRLRFPAMADWLAEALMNTAALSRREDFQPMAVPGLDAVWVSHRQELVAVKGNMVACVTCLPDSSDLQVICAVLAERWGRE